MFADPFDVTTPPNTEAVLNGDDRIRELKRALNERLAQILNGWPDTDPLKVLFNALIDQANTGVIATATATTIFTVPLNIDAIYRVTAIATNGNAVHSITCYVATTTAGSINIFGKQLPAGGTMDITNVVGAIKVTQNTGANATVIASLQRIL